MRQLPAAHMQPPEFRAAVQRRHGLAGIEQTAVIERALHGMEGFELCAAELHAHLIDLLDAHAVLSGDAAALPDTELEDLAAEGFRAGYLVRHVGVEENERVQVAVARVKD